ncbi:hypothetical protein HHK36_011483 [Tetracentron sinense]|uniref:Dof zinc finger protein n=1 Tax=Tetracentron sinense TaxID=13715 RepID=A0A835DHB7_TETSI|nr:hypothetical protein HHK36_011483 [Tetracentron sinense]
MDRRWKPNVELAPNCPRCNSSNTKFCYYNNYSLTQPRYFCKGCRRYWTKGGSLRNVPVGGGYRKNRRGKSVRISTGRSSSYGSVLAGVGRSVSPPHDPTRSSASPIDLALVYAKFLNQQPEVNPGLVIPELPREFGASFDLPIISDPNSHSQVHFSQEHGLAGCQGLSNPSLETHLSGGHQVCLGEFDLNHKQQDRISQFTVSDTGNYELQPFPAEEVVQDLFWLNPPVVGSNFSCHPMQLQRLEPVTEDRSTLHSNNPLNGNWSCFDWSSYGTFSGH